MSTSLSINQRIAARNAAHKSLPEFPPHVPKDRTRPEVCYAMLAQHAAKTAADLSTCPAMSSNYNKDILTNLRKLFIEYAGYAVITSESVAWMQNIIRKMPCLEVGAGLGILTDELRKIGVDATATDKYVEWRTASDSDGLSTEKCATDDRPIPYTSHATAVARLDAFSAISNMQPPCLIWSWPETEHYTAEALNAFKGEEFIYIGEPENGCTGTPKFHQILSRKFRMVESFDIPKFPNNDDRIYHFSRIT